MVPRRATSLCFVSTHNRSPTLLFVFLLRLGGRGWRPPFDTRQRRSGQHLPLHVRGYRRIRTPLCCLRLGFHTAARGGDFWLFQNVLGVLAQMLNLMRHSSLILKTPCPCRRTLLLFLSASFLFLEHSPFLI